MKTHAARNSLLALLALSSLAIYILACTSFSPDDSKVLFTTYDPKAGDFGVGVWDRATGKSSLLFLPQRAGAGGPNDKLAMIRPQWLPDGRHVLVAWARGDDDDALTLAVLPYGQPGTTRFIELEDMEDAASALTMPLAVAQGQVFLAPAQSGSNRVFRVDLLTGEVVTHAMPKRIVPYASPAADRICYLAEEDEAEGKWEFGLLSPGTWELKPLRQIHLKLKDEPGGLCAISPDGKWVVALADNDSGKVEAIVLEDGKERRRARLAKADERLAVSLAALSPVNRACYFTYLAVPDAGTNATFGVLEVPLSGGPPRRTPLIPRLDSSERERVHYAPASVSHDGKLLAVSTTMLAAGDQAMAAADCGLFIVDLTDTRRGFKRVPSPRPPRVQ